MRADGSRCMFFSRPPLVRLYSHAFIVGFEVAISVECTPQGVISGDLVFVFRDVRWGLNCAFAGC